MPIRTRAQSYLITRNEEIAPAAAGTLEFSWVLEQMHVDPEITIERTLRPRSVALQAFGPSMLQEVVVATMPPQKAAELTGHPQMVVEPNHLVFPQSAPVMPPPPLDDPGLVSPFGMQTQWHIRVQSTGGEPVAGATVYLYGHGVPAQGQTDGRGEVTLTLLNESDATLQAIYINPRSDHWSLWAAQPHLTSGTVNTVTLRTLSEMIPGFPQMQTLGWGQVAMRLDQVPVGMTGRGVKVAVIDSGAAVRTHSDLASITSGGDFAGGAAGGPGWTDDIIAHGSHCSGIIAGADDAQGIRGFAPDAELHEIRIFPGGRMDSLQDALDYCLEQGVDVVNMSLGTAGTSSTFLTKLAQAREQGVACIVAAGNSGNAVQFPGISPDVLTVAAIGQEGTFPEDSYHAQQRWRPGGTDQGFFAAKFSCHGPEIDVCGPGVAVVSSVPPDGYASWDGTSMATPHIAGLAALVLAHHPDFQTPALSLPTAARVDRLFEILTNSCRPLVLGGPTRTGSGLPDSLRALGLEGAAPESTSVPTKGDTVGSAIDAALRQLGQEMIASGLLTQLAPASAGAPTAIATEPSILDLQRELTVLRAEMDTAGLLQVHPLDG